MKIAISGKITSGKTTTALKIKEKYKQFEIYNFAGRLKELTAELFDADPKDRKINQDFGEAVRAIDKLAWIRVIQKRIQDKEFVIIDDLRTPDEFDFCKKNGFYIIRLNISPEEQKRRMKNLYKEDWKTHWERRNRYTETALDDCTDFDLVVQSDTDFFPKIENQIFLKTK